MDKKNLKNFYQREIEDFNEQIIKIQKEFVSPNLGANLHMQYVIDIEVLKTKIRCYEQFLKDIYLF